MSVSKAIPFEQPQPDRTPPQNVDLEMCVLGAIMLEPEHAYPLAADYLTRELFYFEGHGIMYELMGELHGRGIWPDSAAMLDELRSRGQLEVVGGSAVVMGMLNSVPTAANVEYHARKVAEKGHLRKMIRTCCELVDECYRQELTFDQIAERGESAMLKVSTLSNADNSVAMHVSARRYWEALSARDEELRERRKAGETDPKIQTGIPTGFCDLDRMLGGLKSGELVIIAARPSMGKTALALSMVHNISVRGNIPAGFFSLEMGEQELTERLQCIGTQYSSKNDYPPGRTKGISAADLRSPNLTDVQWSVMKQAYRDLVNAPIYIDDVSALTIGSLKSRARRMYAKHDVRCLMVDYIQLMTAQGNSESRVLEVAAITRGLKQIARELKIPVIALSQLSREVERRSNRKPQLSDLRESGSIEQDADVVIFIHRPDYYDEKTVDPNMEADHDKFTLPEANLIVAKNRNGPTGVVNLRFFKEIAKFLQA